MNYRHINFDNRYLNSFYVNIYNLDIKSTYRCLLFIHNYDFSFSWSFIIPIYLFYNVSFCLSTYFSTHWFMMLNTFVSYIWIYITLALYLYLVFKFFTPIRFLCLSSFIWSHLSLYWFLYCLFIGLSSYLYRYLLYQYNLPIYLFNLSIFRST